MAVGGYNSGIQNLLLNGMFALWPSGASSAPHGFTLSGAGASVAREGTIIKVGTYSAKLTRSGADCNLYKSIQSDRGIAYWQGRKITLSAWVYATVASRAKITIYDGVDTTSSSLNDGDSDWDFHTITHTVNASATELTIKLECVTGDTSVYFSGIILVEGATSYAFTKHPSDEPNIIYTTTAPNGNIIAQQGTIALYNNSGTYTVWINLDGSTTWQQTNSVIELRTSDPGSPVTGQIWFRTDV